MIKHFKYLERVAEALLIGGPLPQKWDFPAFDLNLSGFVQPKERPRKGKNGRHYTPRDTVVFETKVREAARTRMDYLGLAPFIRPVVVHLNVYDQIDPNTPDWMRHLMGSRLVFERTGGDLDNKEKAVLDALNKTVYRDDKQVVQMFSVRSYAEKAGFSVTVSQIGLTTGDVANIRKIMIQMEQTDNGAEKAQG